MVWFWSFGSEERYTFSCLTLCSPDSGAHLVLTCWARNNIHCSYGSDLVFFLWRIWSRVSGWSLRDSSVDWIKVSRSLSFITENISQKTLVEGLHSSQRHLRQLNLSEGHSYSLDRWGLGAGGRALCSRVILKRSRDVFGQWREPFHITIYHQWLNSLVEIYRVMCNL